MSQSSGARWESQLTDGTSEQSGTRDGAPATRDPSRSIREEEMNKRLRKKKHVGEFTEWGRQLIVTRNRKEEFDEFLDAFIEEAIEANGCYCGGGGSDDKLDLIVELGRRSDDPDARMNRITTWLGERSDVQAWKVGEEFDLWHGDFKDIEEDVALKEKKPEA